MSRPEDRCILLGKNHSNQSEPSSFEQLFAGENGGGPPLLPVIDYYVEHQVDDKDKESRAAEKGSNMLAVDLASVDLTLDGR